MTEREELELKAIMVDNIEDFLCVIVNEKGAIVYPDDLKKLAQYRTIISSPTKESNIYNVKRSDEWFSRYDRMVESNGKKYTLQYFRNISKFKQLEEVLKKDHITGISNRQFAIIEINEYLVHAIRTGEPFTVMLSDVDNFKTINDEYGHLFGDTVLRNFGELIKKNTRYHSDRDKDIAGRYGGDEFFGVIKNINYEDSALWVKRADELAREVKHVSLDGTVEISGVRMSIGMYHVSERELKDFENSTMTLDEIRKTIFNRCDHELYKVKKQHHKEIEESTKRDK